MRICPRLGLPLTWRFIALTLIIAVFPKIVIADKPNLIFPFASTEAWRITCGYGCGAHTGPDAYAIDFSLPGEDDYGQPVLATAAGLVSVHQHAEYGWYVDVDHGGGYISRYAHLIEDSPVADGSYVEQGDFIGSCGCTGSSCEGTHIHFVLYHEVDGVKSPELPEPMSGFMALDEGSTYGIASTALAIEPATGPYYPNDQVTGRFYITNYSDEALVVEGICITGTGPGGPGDFQDFEIDVGVGELGSGSPHEYQGTKEFTKSGQHRFTAAYRVGGVWYPVLTDQSLRNEAFICVSHNLARGKGCFVSTNGADDDVVYGAGINPDDVVDGSLAYEPVESGLEDGCVAWQNVDDNELLSVDMWIDVGVPSRITRIRYNMGDCQRADTWNADEFVSTLGSGSTNPGAPYEGAWTNHNGEFCGDMLRVTLRKTRVSQVTDWLFVGEIEAYGLAEGGQAILQDDIRGANSEFDNAEQALGIPDGSFVSLGVGGELAVDLGREREIADEPGTDIRVVVEPDDVAKWQARLDWEEKFGEAYEAFGSLDGHSWVSLGTGAGTAEFDLGTSGLTATRYIKLVDDGDGDSLSSRPGVDVDAIVGDWSKPRVIHVYPDGHGEYPTIQAAILACGNGDTVMLADGVYKGAGNRDVDFFGREVQVQSESTDPQRCAIDCEGESRAMLLHSHEGPGACIQGITFKNGYGELSGAVEIADASASLADCIFENNASEYFGAAITCERGGVGVRRCQFIDNMCGDNTFGSPAIFMADEVTGTIDSCSFVGANGMYYGGWNGGLLVKDSRFGGGFEGGKNNVYIDFCDSVRFEDCSFDTASLLGGEFAKARISNCQFGGGGIGNMYGLDVAGCEFRSSPGIWNVYGSVRVSDCDFYGGSGGVELNEGDSLRIVQSTFVDIAGYGVRVESGSPWQNSVDSCVVSGCNVGIKLIGAKANVRGTVLVGNVLVCSLSGKWVGADPEYVIPSVLALDECTVANNGQSEGVSAFVSLDRSNVFVDHSIVVGNQGDSLISCEYDSVVVATCSDIYANFGGNWSSCFNGSPQSDGNFSLDPQFCNPEHGDYSLSESSPCISAEDCGRVGALGSGCVGATGVSARADAPGEVPFLGTCQPNPFNPATTLTFCLTASCSVRLGIYNLVGREIKVVVGEELERGLFSVIWDGRDARGHDVPSGIYFARLQAGDFTATRKMVLVR